MEQLDDERRAALGAIWTERAQSELNAGSGFAIVVTELFDVGAETEVLELATRAVHDEVRHAELCRSLAERYLRRPVPTPVAKRVSMPSHPGADAELVKHLHVVGLCCINETLAAGFLEACLEATEGDDLRAQAKQHLADEVQHGRVGWGHLASLDRTTREAIAGFVPRLLEANVRRWIERLGILPPEGIAGHGVPTRDRAIAVIEETVREVVVPGFRHVGVPLTERAPSA